MTPWIAFAPDIRGVCNVEETLDTTSKPTKTAKTKIEITAIGSIYLPPASLRDPP